MEVKAHWIWFIVIFFALFIAVFGYQRGKFDAANISKIEQPPPQTPTRQPEAERFTCTQSLLAVLPDYPVAMVIEQQISDVEFYLLTDTRICRIETMIAVEK